MKNILSTFVKFPFYGWMFILVMVLIGGISLSNMKKATFPIVESNQVTVTVAYPGATPKEMEEGVATLIENAIRGIPGMKEFSSKSSENVAMVTILANYNYDMDEFLSDIKNAVDGISNFPAGAERPIVAKNRSKDMAMFINLVSKNNNLHELNIQANRIEDDFLASGKISQITIFGIPSKMELIVEVDEEALRRYSIDISEITAAISANNMDLHAGAIKGLREEIKVVSRQRSIEPKDIENIIVRTNQSGSSLRVKDLARVSLTFEETPNGSYIEENQGATIMIQKLMNEDLEEISDFLHEYIEEYNASNLDMELRVAHDFMENINSQLSTLISNGLLGVILIMVMLTLFLNFRLSFWVAMGIPLSFLGMFIVALIYGITLNLVSLFGMILIIGILVDDGVVIGENIFTHFEMGKSPRRSAIDGTMEVLPAVLTSVVTTMIAFLPLFFIEGNLKMMAEMAFVIIAVLAFSLIEAFFVLPSHLANPRVLKPLNTKTFYGKIRARSEKFILFIRDRFYLPLLRRIMKNKTISLSTITAMVVLTIALFASGKISFVFFPPAPADMFLIDLALKPGANEEITKEKLFTIDQQIWEVNEELMQEFGDTTDYISSTIVTTGSAFSGTESGTNAGSIRVFLNPLEDSKVNEDIVKGRIAEKTSNIPEAYKYAVGASNRFGAPVSISLLGYDSDELEEAKNRFEDELGKITSLYNITNNSQLGSQELRIELKDEAYTLGLNNRTVVSQIRNAYYGGLVQRIQQGKDEIWLYVRYPRSNRENIGQLEEMMIKTQQGEYPLESIAEIHFDRSLNTINRFNGKREIRVDAYMRDQSESVTPILNEINETIIPALLDDYPDISIQKQGQEKDSAEQMQSMVLYFGIAFLIIILIIMIYFKSYIQGFMVLIMIPLGIVGAVWGHGIHGQPISMMSLWGFIALSGTIINDAIVFIAKYNQNMVKGMKLFDAVYNAAKSRFRAIFLTSVTTTAGLMPLILSNNPDAQFLIPMAIALAYGILFGTIFILAILPVVILIGNQFRRLLAAIFGKKYKNIEDLEVAVVNRNIDLTLEEAMNKQFD
jgi:multidrug efflux pump subunit AcrB